MGPVLVQEWLRTIQAGLRGPLWKREARVTTIADSHKTQQRVKPRISVKWELEQCQGVKQAGEGANGAPVHWDQSRVREAGGRNAWALRSWGLCRIIRQALSLLLWPWAA